MAIKKGTVKIGELRKGTQKIKEAWVGAVKVFASGPPPFTGTLLNTTDASWNVSPQSDPSTVQYISPTWYRGYTRLLAAYNAIVFKKGSIGGRTITVRVSGVMGNEAEFRLLDENSAVVETKKVSIPGNAPPTTPLTFDNNIKDYALQIYNIGRYSGQVNIISMVVS